MPGRSVWFFRLGFGNSCWCNHWAFFFFVSRVENTKHSFNANSSTGIHSFNEQTFSLLVWHSHIYEYSGSWYRCRNVRMLLDHSIWCICRQCLCIIRVLLFFCECYVGNKIRWHMPFTPIHAYNFLSTQKDSLFFSHLPHINTFSIRWSRTLPQTNQRESKFERE